jgi:hypothetical protein
MLKNKHETVSDPSMVKVDKQFRDSSLQKVKILMYGSLSLKTFASGMITWI